MDDKMFDTPEKMIFFIKSIQLMGDVGGDEENKHMVETLNPFFNAASKYITDYIRLKEGLSKMQDFIYDLTFEDKIDK